MILSFATLAGLAWIWLTWSLAFATRMGRAQKIAIAVALFIVCAGSFGALTYVRAVSPTRHHWIFMLTTAFVPVAMYLCLGVIPGTIIDAVLRLIHVIRHALSRMRSVSPKGMEEGSVAPATAPTGADQDSGPASESPIKKPPNRVVAATVRMLSVLALCVSLAVTTLGYISALRPALTPITFTSSQLPTAFDGMRIALITDLHIGPTTSVMILDRVINLVNAADPDLIVIDGDMADGTVAQMGTTMTSLTRLHAEFGVIVTTGNHEFYHDAPQWKDFYISLGFRFLDNDAVTLDRDSQSIDILGINDRQGEAPMKPDLKLANQRSTLASQGSSDPDRFRILIAHEPRQSGTDNDLPHNIGIDLQLSGHTHGGQLWPLNFLTTWEQGASDGVHTLHGIPVVISRGVGSWGPPVRVGASPEIPIITLSRA